MEGRSRAERGTRLRCGQEWGTWGTLGAASCLGE